MSQKLVIRRVRDIADPEVVSLVATSDDYLRGLYPPESNHAEPPDVLVSDTSAFFAGYINEQLVACVAVKIADNDGVHGEIIGAYIDDPLSVFMEKDLGLTDRQPHSPAIES